MVNRVFQKDKVAFDGLSTYKYSDNSNLVYGWDSAMLIRIQDWDNISALTQTAITAYLAGFAFTFAYDD